MSVKLAMTSAAAVLLLAGCAQMEPAESLEPEITLNASFESDEPDVKTALQDGGKQVYWEPGDRISVFFNGAGGVFVSNNTELAAKTTFSGSLNTLIGATEGDVATSYIWGLYPYSAGATCDGTSVSARFPGEQTARPGSFGSGSHFALARSNSFSLAFYNVCGGIRFTLTEEGINRIVLRRADSGPLAGDIRITVKDGLPYTQWSDSAQASFSDEIVLKAPEGGVFQTGKWYYISLIPGELTGGFSLEFQKVSGMTATMSTAKTVTVKRGVYGSVEKIDSGLEFADERAVDLGLSVKWAKCNLGASGPEEYGGYYAWGETSTKSSYYESNYQWLDGGSLTKYYGETYVLELADDAAYAELGGSWRMPTEEEMEELLTGCTWTWDTKNNVDGYTVSGKGAYAGKSIFIPAAGYLSGKYNTEEGWGGRYWTSTLYYANKFNAIMLDFMSTSTSLRTTDTHRENGLPIRPVFCESVTGVTLDRTTMELQLDKTEKLTATVYPIDATNKALEWSSTDSSVASVDQEGNVTGRGIGSADIIVTTVNGGKSAKCAVTVIAPAYEYVDLGLSVKWATYNMGAMRPEAYGSYLAWGESKPKSSYTWGTYLWCSGNDPKTLTRYNFNEEYGVFDNLYMLTPDDDPAREKWGGNWRMPTSAEWSALKNFCTWTWEKRDGVWGYKVSGKGSYSGNSIFLPAGGFMAGSERSLAGSDGYYWASDLYENGVPSDAFAFGFDSSDRKLYAITRQTGYLVRPVYAEPTTVSWVEMDCTSNYIYFGESLTLKATVLPETATDKRVTWSSDNPDIVSVNQEGKVTAAKKAGVATITATTTYGGLKARCTLSTMKAVRLAELGLSVNWASCNVGADYSEQYGDYFAWGETDPKRGYFADNYLWYDHPSTKLTKYNSDSDFGNVDNKVVLDRTDDAAHAQWGGKWRTPTAEEWLELLDSCTWETYEINGVKGKRGVSKDPNFYSIFIPFAGGCYSSTEADGKGEVGEYWSSSRVLSNNPRNAYTAKFTLYVDSHITNSSRPTGLPIRAVADK